MKEWILGLLIAIGVVSVLLLLLWYCDKTLPHVLRNGYKKLLNTYFVQYITLISAAAAMYDLVVVACTVRKTDTERIGGDKHVCVHSGRLGRCISDFSLAVLLSTYIFVAVVMVIAGWTANKEVMKEGVKAADEAADEAVNRPVGAFTKALSRVWKKGDLGHINPQETTVFGSLKYCRDTLRMRRTKYFKFAMIFLTLAITINIAWLAYFIFQKDSEALPSFLVTSLAIYLLLKPHIILVADGGEIYDVRKYNNIGQIQIMQPLELTVPGDESGLSIPWTEVLNSADFAEDLFNEATLKIVAAGKDSEKLDDECHKLMKKIVSGGSWTSDGPEDVLYQDFEGKKLEVFPGEGKTTSKYVTIWKNHLKDLVRDLREGKAAEPYKPKAAGADDPEITKDSDQ